MSYPNRLIRPARNDDAAKSFDGLTLTELLVALSILSLLCLASWPQYLDLTNKARQSDTANQVNLLLSSIQAYREEFLDNPSGWEDLARVLPVKKDDGVANDSTFTAIKSSNGGFYKIQVQPGSNNQPTTITATPNQASQRGWSIKACINTETGISDITKQRPGGGLGTPRCN